MEDIKEKIIDALERHPKGSMTDGDLREDLGIEGGSDFAAMEKALKEMEEDYLIARENNGGWVKGEDAGYIQGKISVNARGMGFIDRDDADTIRIDQRDQKEALDGDTVVIRMKGEGFGTVVKVLKHAHEKVIGTYMDARPHLVLDDAKLQTKILKVEKDDSFTPIQGMKVQCQITDYGDNILTVKIIRVIGYKDDPGVDILSILLDHDIEPEFPDDVKEETARIPQSVSEEEMQGRVDLRAEDTVTIDGDDSKDFDDAVAVKKDGDGWILKVSIADVSHYVTPGSPLDKEAYKRGCSTYVTDRVVPMLPHELSNGICSLNPHVDRLANTCEMKIDAKGNTVSYKVYASVINSTERMTYHNVNLILDGDEEMCAKYQHLGTLFTDLRDCADAIRARRVRQGAIDFDTPEAEIKVDENGNPTDVVLRQRGHAERMIEDCMIAANCAVANQMKWAEVPCVYRIHEEPEAKRVKMFIRTSAVLGHRFIPRKSTLHPKEFQTYLDGLKDTPEYPVLSMMMLRCMSKAKYDPACVGHFGLAEKEYLHFTSPIRRYPDLVVHRMLRKYIYEGCTDEAEMKKDFQLMADDAEQSSIRERESQDAEYDCDDMKKAQYMEKFVGETFTGIISGVTGFGFYVQLPNTIEGMVRLNDLHDDFYEFNEDRMELIGQRTRRVFRIGMEVKVLCAGTSRDLGQVDFMIPNASRPTGGQKGRAGWSRGRRGGDRHGVDRSRHSSGRRSNYNGRRK
jgi:ribonuclease R